MALRPLPRRAPSALVALTALVLSACGGDEGSEAAAGSPDGEPIAIGVVGAFEAPGFGVPEFREGVEVGVAALNERGGIAGRPVEVKACNDQNTAAAAAACYRTFADDDEVIAIVGGASSFLEGSVSVVRDSGLPILGDGSIPSSTEPFGVPVTSSVAVETLGVAEGLIRDGSTRIGFVLIDSGPTTDQTETLLRTYVDNRGAQLVEVARTDPAVVDLSPAVATLLDAGVDGVGIVALPTTQQAAIRALRQAGYDAPISVLVSPLPPDFLSALGPAAEGLIGASAFLPVSATGITSPGLERLRAELERHQPDAARTSFLQGSWLAVQLFEQAATAAAASGEGITRAAVLDAARSLNAFDSGGILPEADLTKPGPLPGLPNVVSTDVAILEGSAEGWTWDGEFVDVGAGVAA